MRILAAVTLQRQPITEKCSMVGKICYSLLLLRCFLDYEISLKCYLYTKTNFTKFYLPASFKHAC